MENSEAEEKVYATDDELREILEESRQQLLELYGKYTALKKQLWDTAYRYALINLYFNGQWCREVGGSIGLSAEYIERAIDKNRLSENIIEGFVKYERNLQNLRRTNQNEPERASKKDN